jgi:PTS system glucitol/sorbitol-specific IIA component
VTAPSLHPDRGAAQQDAELYATQVVAVGPMAGELVAGGVLVLFGEQAPQELHDFSVLHRPTTAVAGPAPGDTIVLGDTALPVLAVGSVVADNLLNLGHLDLKADGATTPAMPGDVCVPTGTLPQIEVGQPIRILRPGGGAAP